MNLTHSAYIVNTDAEQDNVEWVQPLNTVFLSSLLKSVQKDIGVTSENKATYFVLAWFVKGMVIALFCCHFERNTFCASFEVTTVSHEGEVPRWLWAHTCL